MQNSSRFHACAFALVAMAAMYYCVAPIAARADARQPTAREIATFLPLICEHPRPAADSTQCARLIAFPALLGGSPPDGPAPAPRFAAIVYGSFTRAGADQAYVTYYSNSVEGHVTNFGGGILFERTKGVWKLVRWYRGGQMDGCIPIPATNPLKLLCATGYTNQGESDESVLVRSVPATGNALASDPPLLQAHDLRATQYGDKNGCYTDTPKGQAYLLGIGFLPTPHGSWQWIATSSPQYFAETHVQYETGADIAAACSGSHPRKVRETNGIVRFAWRSGRVVMSSPITFYNPPE